ncbi:MAG: HD domain-containing protein [Selenomonadaceae bacterium]|nr:HD domain-containing protein [Selenomonadaceae bacterium]
MKDLLKEMHTWMANYMKSFYTEDEEVQNGICLKELHTGYVTAHSRELAAHLGLDGHHRQLAEIVGLFHDVGRFRQYTLYKTFNDSRSEDHADLGLKVLDELPFMKKLTAEDEAVVRFAIGNHNKKEIAPTEDKWKLLMAKIIRDADKLDIYRVLRPYLTGKGAEGAPNFIKVDAAQEISPDFMEIFVAGGQADYHQIRTHGDRKLVRLLWVYDINFSWTLQRVVEAGYVDDIIASLEPRNDRLEMGIRRLRDYIGKKCAEKDSIAV